MAKRNSGIYKIGTKIQIDWYDHVEVDHRAESEEKLPTVVIKTMGVYVGSDKMHRKLSHHYHGPESGMNDVIKILKRAIKHEQPAFNLEDIRHICLTYDAVMKKLYGFYLFTFVLSQCNIKHSEKKLLREWKSTISSLTEK
jgi:hypothetical protein